MRRTQIVVLAVAVGLVAFTAGFVAGSDLRNEPESAPLTSPATAQRLAAGTTPSTVAATNAVPADPTPTAQGEHEPGPADVSTMEKGEQFDATPNLFYISSCGDACWLPTRMEPDTKSVEVTDGYPCEYYLMGSGPACSDHNSADGDKVHVVCQTQGNGVPDEGSVQNDIQQRSNLWDKYEIPADRVRQGSGLQPEADGKYYGYANDLWLGNTGDHGIPCQ